MTTHADGTAECDGCGCLFGTTATTMSVITVARIVDDPDAPLRRSVETLHFCTDRDEIPEVTDPADEPEEDPEPVKVDGCANRLLAPEHMQHYHAKRKGLGDG